MTTAMRWLVSSLRRHSWKNRKSNVAGSRGLDRDTSDCPQSVLREAQPTRTWRSHAATVSIVALVHWRLSLRFV